MPQAAAGNQDFSWLRHVTRKLPCMQVRTGISTRSYGNFGLRSRLARSAPPGGEGDARDDEREAHHEVPRAQSGDAWYRTLREVIHHDPGETEDQADHDGRADPRRTDLPPRRLRRRRGVDRPLADARLGHDGLLRSKPGDANQRSNPVMRT